MSELARKIEKARGGIDVGWSDDRARVVERAMVGRKRRRGLVRRAGQTGAALIVVVGVGFGVHRFVKGGTKTEAMGGAPTSTAGLASNAVQTRAGDLAVPIGADDIIRHSDTPDGHVTVGVERGGVRVVSTDANLLSVESNGVHVEGGGAFTVEKIGDRTKVTVARGHLTVGWALETRAMGGGEVAVFPPDDVGSAPSASSLPAPSSGTRANLSPAPSGSATTWRSLAQSGDYDAAWVALSSAGPSSVREEASDLMLLADVARLSGHPDRAVSPLERVLSAHSRDPRAPLAAFTLGRVELEQLGRPGDAASAFEKARLLAPDGPLAEDSLAREVEAWSRAGDVGKAHDRAMQYVAAFPDGRRLRAVKKFGGLD